MRQRNFSQPGQLAFGKLARGDNAFFDKGVIIGFAFEIIPSLTVAHAAHRRHIGMQLRIVAA